MSETAALCSLFALLGAQDEFRNVNSHGLLLAREEAVRKRKSRLLTGKNWIA